jgi:hypothetical protein
MRNDTEEMANEKIPEPQSPEESHTRAPRLIQYFAAKAAKGAKTED